MKHEWFVYESRHPFLTGWECKNCKIKIMECDTKHPHSDKICNMKYNCEQLVALLPEHWEVIPIDSKEWSRYCDDGRDYDLPMFMRKDKLARIYINAAEHDTPYMFAISFDEHADGECDGDFATAIEMCDDYVADYPLDPIKDR